MTNSALLYSFINRWNNQIPSVEELANRTKKDLVTASQWLEDYYRINKINPDAKEDTSTVEQAITRIIENTNIVMVDFGNVHFNVSPKIKGKLYEFAYHAENDPIYLRTDTQEVLSILHYSDDFDEEPIKVAKDMASFLDSLLLYSKLYTNKTNIGINPTEEQIEALYTIVGGREYQGFYEELIDEILRFDK
ncbi:hypothetical protein QNI19_17775 [Cytophagaceae bacterium DM2B3-1]|uniref:Uncharacterized protein n=1 Tax=Xanthocytophaga flava TaxID=3048013 RepID=A0ABT7CM09_9BACT|nr:hypothetical protein [Xanthocytophaga flavus]MDJ1494793.1 hypothetical protein [Xanthocytophaga flavus]